MTLDLSAIRSQFPGSIVPMFSLTILAGLKSQSLPLTESTDT